MDRSVNFRLDNGTYLIVEASAKASNQTVSAWLREAIHEHVRDHVERQVMSRLDERIYKVMKDVAEVKKVLVHGFGETKKGFVIIEQRINELVVEVEGE